MAQCAVKLCNSRADKEHRSKGVTFHSFPHSNPRLLEKWLKKINREGDKKPWRPNSYQKLCSLHFTPDSFDRSGRVVKLKDRAIPTIFEMPKPPQKPEKPEVVNERPVRKATRAKAPTTPTQTPPPTPPPPAPTQPSSSYGLRRRGVVPITNPMLYNTGLELVMECEEEALSPCQIEAARKAKEEYRKGLKMVEEAKLEVARAAAKARADAERIAAEAARAARANSGGSTSPDIMIIGESPPQKKAATWLARALAPKPVSGPISSPGRVIGPRPAAVAEGAGAVPEQLHRYGNVGQNSVFQRYGTQKGASNNSGTPSSMDMPVIVSGTSGLGIKRPINAPDDYMPPSSFKRQRVRLITNSSSSNSSSVGGAGGGGGGSGSGGGGGSMGGGGNWVPLDEYYYGKMEGDPTFSEEKSEFRFRCWMCTKMLYNNVKAMMHLQGHIDSEKQQNLDLSDLTQCKHCYKQFDTPFEMQTHIEKVHLSNKNVLMCRICEKGLDSRSALTAHMRQNHCACEMPYTCQLCHFRSSMYSDVVDHFKKKHDSSDSLLCLYCLRVFHVKFVSQGWGQTQTYYHHLLRHQSKTNNRKCTSCKLYFFNSQDMKQHRRTHHQPNQRGVIGVNMKHNTPDQVMIKLPEAGFVSPKSSGPKSLNAPTFSKVMEHRGLHLPVETSTTYCFECKTLMSTGDHYKKYVQCSMCRFATSCSFAYASHMMGFHSGQVSSLSHSVPRERPMASPVYCLCGFSSKMGNKIANHLVFCSKRTGYLYKPEVPVVERVGQDETDPRRKPDASILDVLGLVKKQSILPPRESSELTSRRDEDTGSEWKPTDTGESYTEAPPPVDAPSINLDDTERSIVGVSDSDATVGDGDLIAAKLESSEPELANDGKGSLAADLDNPDVACVDDDTAACPQPSPPLKAEGDDIKEEESDAPSLIVRDSSQREGGERREAALGLSHTDCNSTSGLDRESAQQEATDKAEEDSLLYDDDDDAVRHTERDNLPPVTSSQETAGQHDPDESVVTEQEQAFLAEHKSETISGQASDQAEDGANNVNKNLPNVPDAEAETIDSNIGHREVQKETDNSHVEGRTESVTKDEEVDESLLQEAPAGEVNTEPATGDVLDEEGAEDDVTMEEEEQLLTDVANNQQTTEGVDKQETTEGANNQQTTDGANDQQTTYGANNQQTTEGANNQQTTEGANDQQTTEGANNQQTTDGANDQQTTEGANNQQTTEGANNQQTTEGANDQQKTEGANDQQTTDGANDQQTTDGANDQQTTDDVDKQETTSKHGEEDVMDVEESTGVKKEDVQMGKDEDMNLDKDVEDVNLDEVEDMDVQNSEAISNTDTTTDTTNSEAISNTDTTTDTTDSAITKDETEPISEEKNTLDIPKSSVQEDEGSAIEEEDSSEMSEKEPPEDLAQRRNDEQTNDDIITPLEKEEIADAEVDMERLPASEDGGEELITEEYKEDEKLSAAEEDSERKIPVEEKAIEESEFAAKGKQEETSQSAVEDHQSRGESGGDTDERGQVVNEEPNQEKPEEYDKNKSAVEERSKDVEESMAEEKVVDDIPNKVEEENHGIGEDKDYGDSVGKGIRPDQPEESHHQSEESHHQPEETHHQPEESHHQPEETHHQPEETHHQPEETHHQPEKTHHQPEETHHQPEKTHHQPEESHHQPEKTHHQPEETHHQPEKTHHQPEKTHHQPEKTHHQPYKQWKLVPEDSSSGQSQSIPEKLSEMDVSHGDDSRSTANTEESKPSRADGSFKGGQQPPTPSHSSKPVEKDVVSGKEKVRPDDKSSDRPSGGSSSSGRGHQSSGSSQHHSQSYRSSSDRDKHRDRDYDHRNRSYESSSSSRSHSGHYDRDRDYRRDRDRDRDRGHHDRYHPYDRHRDQRYENQHGGRHQQSGHGSRDRYYDHNRGRGGQNRHGQQDRSYHRGYY